MAPSIVIDKDSVTIEGVRIPRPVRMSRSQWIEWWEEASNGHEGAYRRGLADFSSGERLDS